MKYTWEASKDRTTGHTIIEVSLGDRMLVATLTPYKAKTITPKEFNRLIKALGEALETLEKE
ncbi:MAG: hypothetical protein GOVbin1096_104 [Prokaryotic dsDNA virus sp.]|jgi:hypothetical protein|nr:MAG: hypothetical protein GOVbin1096_104 [Prokaryotic dsDNA virus sp.]|tara:strand:+ start:22583 stop:22768 length:186 start_codon:yes stop_codon:yes gene_type:complete